MNLVRIKQLTALPRFFGCTRISIHVLLGEGTEGGWMIGSLQPSAGLVGTSVHRGLNCQASMQALSAWGRAFGGDMG